MARYRGGQELHEVYDRPPLTPWEGVEPERLAVLELRDLWPTGEGTVVALDVDKGTFLVRGKRLELALGPVPISDRDGRYTDVVQYKQAHSDYRPGHGSTTVLDAHAIGYRRELPEMDVKALVRLDVATRELGLEVRVGPRRPTDVDPGEVRVVIEGERVPGEAAFRRLTAPGEVG